MSKSRKKFINNMEYLNYKVRWEDSRKDITFINFKVYKNNKLKILVSFILIITVSMIDLVFPQLTRRIIDNAIGGHDVNLLVKLSILYGVLSITSVCIDVILE